jgi:hypothetical protein
MVWLGATASGGANHFRIKSLLVFITAMALFSPLRSAWANGNINVGVWCRGCIYVHRGQLLIDQAVLANPNIRGFTYHVPWNQLEPGDGVFDWSSITTLEAQLHAGQYLAVYPIMGVHAPGWLQAATGTYVWPHHFTIPVCSVQRYPLFTDPAYVRGWKDFVAAFDTQFHNDPKIARTSIPPFSNYGLDTETSAPCWPINTSTCNGQGELIINGGPPQGCISDNYINEWRNDSGCGADQTCFINLVTSTYDSLFSYEYSQFQGATFQMAGFFAPLRFPNLAWPGSGFGDSGAAIINPALINYAYATAGSDFMLGNESLGPGLTNNGFVNFMTSYCTAGIPCIAQHKLDLASYPGDCSTLVQTDNIGLRVGVKLIEMYHTSILYCPNEIARVKSILDP